MPGEDLATNVGVDIAWPDVTTTDDTGTTVASEATGTVAMIFVTEEDSDTAVGLSICFLSGVCCLSVLSCALLLLSMALL